MAYQQRQGLRGFAAMDPGRQRQIASMGGRAAHKRGVAHEFDSQEARAAGRKGGIAVSRDREHMAEIGRVGGQHRHHGAPAQRRARAQTARVSAERRPSRRAARPAARRVRGGAGAMLLTDHDLIMQWVAARDGWPATVKGTRAGDDPAGILRIDFPQADESLREISWDEFFEKFDQANLGFLAQDVTKDGSLSRFCKFVSRGR